VIIAGHTRWKAAKKLGLTKVPVHVATDLTPAQIKAYRIADNKTGELAEWDLEILPIELTDLREGGFDMEVLAFDDDELAKLLSEAAGVTEGLTDADAVPEPPDDPITQPGDIWLLGDPRNGHRLMCGDSSSAGDLDRLLDGATIDLVNMDPPYNVKVEPRSNNAIAAGNSSFPKAESRTHHQSFDVARQGEKKATHKKMRAKDRPLANDFVTDEAFDKLLAAWFNNAARVLKPGGSFYIWGGYANLGNYPGPLKKAGLYFSQGIVWDKQHPVLTRKDMMGAFEIAFYGWREGAGHHFYGPNNATDLWHVKKVNPQSMVHLTEKPVELAVRAIQYSSKTGQNVLDLFGGSGSTLIGCEQTDRRAFLMEIDQAYCDVIVQRWEQFTGRKAERAAGVSPAGDSQ
ncbi:MAG: chromosome partitioning protein ParB, partial [Phycisphaera sp.]|nr:chromosome partitioning protein ParB [Phycisphaera sp.]